MDLAEAMADEVVLVGETLYSHIDFVDAFHAAYLDRLADMVPEGASVRQGIKVLRSLKTKESHAAILSEALALLKEKAVPVDPDSLQRDKHAVVASFPVGL